MTGEGMDHAFVLSYARNRRRVPATAARVYFRLLEPAGFYCSDENIPRQKPAGGERAARLGTDGHRFQTEGVNRKSIGKISRRPISISPVRINFEKFENAE